MRPLPARENRNDRTYWRKILALGEEILGAARESPSSASLTGLHKQLLYIQGTAQQLFQATAALWLSPSVLRSFSAGWKDANIQTELAQFSNPSRLMQRAARNLRPASEKSRHTLAIPLVTVPPGESPQVVMGVLQVERPAGRSFTQGEGNLIEIMANQIRLALEASQQIALEHWRLDQLDLVHQVSTQLADVHNLDELARRVADLILCTFGYYYTAIFTLEADQELLRLRASAGPAQPALGKGKEDGFSPALSIQRGQGIIGHVAQTGQEVIAQDVQTEALYRGMDTLPETRSEATLPIKIQERLLGVLDVQSDQIDDFDATDVLVLHALAGSIASAIEGAWLYAELNQRASQLSAVVEVSSAITSILDEEKLLTEVANLIQRHFGYPYVHLFSVHPGRRKVFYEAGTGAYDQALRSQRFSLDLDDTQGMLPWVARSGQTLLVNDTRQEPLYRPAELPDEATLSELTVPLTFGGEVLGVLDIQSDRSNAFGAQDRFIMETLASNIAIALRNATLYRSESWRRQAADSLREVAGMLSTEADLDQVLEAILSELDRNLPLDLAAIWLRDEENETHETTEKPTLRLAALSGLGADMLDVEMGMTPAEVMELNPSLVEELEPEMASVWLNQALEANEPAIRSAQSLFEPLGAALDFPEDYSAIAAPLRVGEQPVGVLILAHRTAGRYGSEAGAMTAAFASYAAVAIENTRLYEAAHDQAWISTVLLQVSQATQTHLNLAQLLDTVIRITPLLVGVKACLLYMLEEDGYFLPAVSTGLPPEQEEEFKHRRFLPEDIPALAKLLEYQQPVLVGEAEEERQLSILLEPELARKPSQEVGLQVLVPLLARGEVLGAFLVNYGPNASNGASSKNLDDFFEERLPIIQGIAHQTAIAVENIRLLKSQREEAYISVALLQVAQAVVSSNDLDEALGAIVRITPILVGVERALIYLWDQSGSAFHLRQSYGLPRAVEALPAPAGEFPILDRVRQENRLVAYPCQNELWTEEELPEAWAVLEPPTSDQMDEILTSEPRLLMAYPLAVRDEVLGVFLVEEPSLPLNEGFGGEANNQRLRPRRTEIITGISQQAALAIQNDLLQREMVERQRLENEMQLARQIQRTFLPQVTPDLPGWDLQVLWKTAREVGGDFYDFFELPDDRLGLVIADVADKGMPAALFMVLVRTLVRAAVQEARNPAEVLMRVNDILVPDAPQGMFVTLAYAVLDLKSGKLEYANAGHNPPVLLRWKEQTVEQLTRTGMALGVMEGWLIEERQVNLEPGDYLVMYTDGVTESFAANQIDEIYGEERLLERLQEATANLVGGQPPGAQGILDAIEQSVAAFTGTALPTDDLTVMVLHCSQPYP